MAKNGRARRSCTISLFQPFSISDYGYSCIILFWKRVGRRVKRPNLRTCSEIGNCRICQILYRVLLSCFFIERNPTVLFGSERKGAYRAVRRFSARFIHDGRYCRKYTAERLFFFGICRIGNILCHLDRSQNIFAHR